MNKLRRNVRYTMRKNNDFFSRDVNKKRSLNYAASKNQGIMYCIATDRPSTQALRERPDLSARKLEFLSRHDRESGGLYGILQLIKGMPVDMTDHIDRSIDKRILRGRVGHVHSWVLHAEEKVTLRMANALCNNYLK